MEYNNYYVYGLCFEDGRVFYIGKGVGRRILYHFKDKILKDNSHRSRTILKEFSRKRKIILKFFEKNLGETEALLLEIKLIKQFGRADKKEGILTNKTDGGDGTSGRIVTEEQRIRYTKANTIRWTEEARKEQSELKKKQLLVNPSLHPTKGKKHSIETRQKMSEKAKGRKLSKETINKRTESLYRNRANKKCN